MKILTVYICILKINNEVLAWRVASESAKPASQTLTSSVATNTSERIGGKIEASLVAVNILGSNILAVAIA